MNKFYNYENKLISAMLSMLKATEEENEVVNDIEVHMYL